MEMKRFIITTSIILCGFVALVSILLTLRYTYNVYLVHRYNQNDYYVSTRPLEIFNIPESYVVHYNKGNMLYQRMEYEEAIESYDKALKWYVPKKKECLIRINKSLAMVKTVEYDYLNPTLNTIDDTIAVLEDARDNLLEKGCATEDFKGHNADADTLRDEIQKMIDELEKQKEQQQQEQDQQNQDQNQQNQNQNQQNQNNNNGGGGGEPESSSDNNGGGGGEPESSSDNNGGGGGEPESSSDNNGGGSGESESSSDNNGGSGEPESSSDNNGGSGEPESSSDNNGGGGEPESSSDNNGGGGEPESSSDNNGGSGEPESSSGNNGGGGEPESSSTIDDGLTEEERAFENDVRERMQERMGKARGDRKNDQEAREPYEYNGDLDGKIW